MKKFSHFLLVLLLVAVHTLLSQETIDVNVIGLSDGKRDSKQKDREEAIINAKLQAIEKAGVNIKSVTTVENFMMMKDWIESQSAAYLLPGFNILDMGYGDDGIYRIVLVGKISTNISSAELTGLAIHIKPKGDEIPYRLFVDGSFLCESSGVKDTTLDDLSTGDHVIDITTQENNIWTDPKYRFAFSDKLSKTVNLAVGKLNSCILEPHFTTYDDAVTEEKYRREEIENFSNVEKGIEFVDKDGNEHTVKVKIINKGGTLGLINKYEVQVFHNDELVNTIEGKSKDMQGTWYSGDLFNLYCRYEGSSVIKRNYFLILERNDL